MLISVVMPVYNEETIIPVLYDRLNNTSMNLDDWDFEFIFVDDGSSDRSLFMLQELKKDDQRIKVLSFSRNFGHQAAITAGMDNAAGDIIITMDSDLQDPPELIVDIIKVWRSGCDVVHATRRSRKGETWFKKASATLYYRMMKRLGVNIMADTGDFRLITREVAEALRGMNEKRLFIRGMIPWLGFKEGQVYYDRDPRLCGVTRYSLAKMLRLAGDGVFSFSTCLPKVPFFFAIVSLLLQKWDSMMILISLGIIAEYALRIYDEVRGRPIYLLKNQQKRYLTPRTIVHSLKKLS